MMQPSTTMMKILAIRFSMTFIILGNHEETLKPLSLPSKQRLVSRYSEYFNNFLHQMSEGKIKKSEFIRLNQLCAAVLVFINVQQYPIAHKT